MLRSLPLVALLLLWMIVPLGMTLYFSLIRYNLLYPGENQFVGLENFTYFITDSGFLPGATNTLLLVGSVLLISVVFGVLISALLEASEFFGRGVVRVLLISPFFIMPSGTIIHSSNRATEGLTRNQPGLARLMWLSPRTRRVIPARTEEGI